MRVNRQDGAKVIPKMFNIRNSPTVVVDARDSQLHQAYTMDSDKTAVLSESQLVALILRSIEIANPSEDGHTRPDGVDRTVAL